MGGAGERKRAGEGERVHVFFLCCPNFDMGMHEVSL